MNTGNEQLSDGMPEQGIRKWYGQKTRKSRRVLGSLFLLAVGGVALFHTLSSRAFTEQVHTVNGAWTIPAFGALWLAAFIVLWLAPMREVSFRSQEAMERMERRLAKFLDEEATPTLKIWRQLGERISVRLDDQSLDDIVEGIRGLAELNRPMGTRPDTRSALAALRKNGGEKGTTR